MARSVIQPTGLRDPRPHYSSAWRVGNTIYVAGQTARQDEGTAWPGDIRAQTRTALERIQTILQEAGASMRDVVKINVYVTDIRDREGFSEVRQEFWPSDPPASTLVQIIALAPQGALIEIEATAVLD